MSNLPLIAMLVGGPVLGAVGAILQGYTRPWQVILGAILGEAIGSVVARAWSEHVAAELMRSGRDAVIVRATGLTWEDHLITIAIAIAFSSLMAGVVMLIRRLVFPGNG